TRTIIGSFVCNLIRSLFSWIGLSRLPVARGVVVNENAPVPRATAVNVANTATATVAATHFLLERSRRNACLLRFAAGQRGEDGWKPRLGSRPSDCDP